MLNRIITLSTLALLSANPASAQLLNGDFETWSGNSPQGWSTIDSGIAVSSATRLIADGYQGYSNNGLTNQWQELTFSYTATSTKSIPVGLRFYDVSGFDGSEVVYIDNFQPTESATTPTEPESCSATTATLSLTTDQYASETSWLLKNSSGTTLFSGSGYENSTTYNQEMCLSDGQYTFEILDSYGDGICCGVGNGSYSLVANGNTLASGGEFTQSQLTSFTIGDSGTTTKMMVPFWICIRKKPAAQTVFILPKAPTSAVNTAKKEIVTTVNTLSRKVGLVAQWNQ